MKNLKLKIPIIFIISSFFYGCQFDVPISELSEAKSAVTKAENHSAETYAPEELAKAKELIKESHTSIKEEKKSDSVKFAIEAKEAAESAFKKSIEPLAKDTIENAEKINSEAQKANAEEFAPDEYKNAADKIKNSKELFENKSFENSYTLADEAEKQALTAKSESLKNKPTLEDKSGSIKVQADQIKSNNGMKYASDEINLITQNLENANKSLEENNLVDAIKYLDEATLSLENAKTKETEYLKIFSIKQTIDDSRELLKQANDALADETAPEIFLEASNLIESSEKKYNEGNHEEARKESDLAKIKSAEALKLALENKPVYEKDLNEVKTRYQLFEDKNAAEKSPEDMKNAKENIDLAKTTFDKNNFRKTRAYINEAKNALDTAESSNPELMLISKINQAENEYNFLNTEDNRKDYNENLDDINSKIMKSKEYYENSEKENALSDINKAIMLIDELKISLNQSDINTIPDNANTKSYTVKYNPKNRDCLWKISEKVYKRADLWPLIYAANRDKIKDPDLIFPGQKFVIPPVPEKESKEDKKDADDSSNNNAIIDKKEDEIVTDEDNKKTDEVEEKNETNDTNNNTDNDVTENSDDNKTNENDNETVENTDDEENKPDENNN